MNWLKKLFASPTLKLRSKCDDLGGTYIEGGLWKGDWIEFDYRGRTIYLQVIRDTDSPSLATWFSVGLKVSNRCNLLLMRKCLGQSLYGVAAAISNVSKLDSSQFETGTVAYSKRPEFAIQLLQDPRLIELVNENSGLALGMGQRSFLLKGVYGRELFVAVLRLEIQVDVLKSLLQLTQRLLDLLADAGEIELASLSE